MIWALIAAAALFGPTLVILAGVGVGEWRDRQRTREELGTVVADSCPHGRSEKQPEGIVMKRFIVILAMAAALAGSAAATAGAASIPCRGCASPFPYSRG